MDPNHTNLNGWHALIFSVLAGHIEVVDYFLFEQEMDDDLKDKDAKTALDHAEEQGDDQIADLFKEKLYQTGSRSQSPSQMLMGE
mmetsp:Transcript_26309/g.25486  ORF Transcript_26309/g.25486 Transcript_26309/m.25486 type:complete len:85 (+) Transcript_26309:278-532(+)|eukprot:CAMPEP_0170541388 /NCGR_PEP_ID=MMETSP0211-20121228/1134_1 /TAXON_ID=311385 /ORGANISM="Pseudokeronopsis sp., Strain OXSARD2" /LENGTH=84 /DNA_ID=CAMNT_0010844091 /DNA_START=233 /DNA_END=487 /DNA_ORIENTATION=+